MPKFWLILPLLALGACASPADGDDVGGDDSNDGGGTQDPDADGDGLRASEEATYGTSDTAWDSDGDTYGDYDEVQTGHDPANADDKIYFGGWPYNAHKDEMEQGDTSKKAKEGNIVPRFEFQDQFGDWVDTYDFAGQGKDIAMDLSGEWCSWCNELAKLIEGKRSALKGYGWDEIGEVIDAGDIYWLTVLDADWSYGSITHEEAIEWYDQYENPHIPVLADTEMEVAGWVNPSGYPTVWLADSTMTITVMDKADYTQVLQYVMDTYYN